MRNKFYLILLAILVLVVGFYVVDRNVLIKRRVMRHNLWEHTGGDRIRGDFIETRWVRFKGDTMIFDHQISGIDTIIGKELHIKGGDSTTNHSILAGFMGQKDSFQNDNIVFKRDTTYYEFGGKGEDTLILKHQYFSTMTVTDPKTGKTGKYSMKGASWVDYLFKKQ